MTLIICIQQATSNKQLYTTSNKQQATRERYQMNQFIEVEDIIKEKDIRGVKKMTSSERRAVDEDYSGKPKGKNISLPFSSLLNVKR